MTTEELEKRITILEDMEEIKSSKPVTVPCATMIIILT